MVFSSIVPCSGNPSAATAAGAPNTTVGVLRGVEFVFNDLRHTLVNAALCPTLHNYYS